MGVLERPKDSQILKHIYVIFVSQGDHQLVWIRQTPATFPPDHVAEFGSDVPLKRAGQPNVVAPYYVFLASADASYITGQVLHPNGGEIVNS